MVVGIEHIAIRLGLFTCHLYRIAIAIILYPIVGRESLGSIFSTNLATFKSTRFGSSRAVNQTDKGVELLGAGNSKRGHKILITVNGIVGCRCYSFCPPTKVEIAQSMVFEGGIVGNLRAIGPRETAGTYYRELIVLIAHTKRVTIARLKRKAIWEGFSFTIIFQNLTQLKYMAFGFATTLTIFAYLIQPNLNTGTGRQRDGFASISFTHVERNSQQILFTIIVFKLRMLHISSNIVGFQSINLYNTILGGIFLKMIKICFIILVKRFSHCRKQECFIIHTGWHTHPVVSIPHFSSNCSIIIVISIV